MSKSLFKPPSGSVSRFVDHPLTEFIPVAVLRVFHTEVLLMLTSCAFTNNQEASKTDRSTDLPKRKFKVEEIEEDEKRRDIELYGPPTPPRRPRQIGAMVCHPLTPYCADSQGLASDSD